MSHESTTFRKTVSDTFAKAGVEVTPHSCLLVPVSHFSAIKTTIIKHRGGLSYEAAVFVLPIDRLSTSIQEVPFGEEAFCAPPSQKTVLMVRDNPRTTTKDKPSRYPLTWEHLRTLRGHLKGARRPRKQRFTEAVAMLPVGPTLSDEAQDSARRQYYAYASGPLDDTELLGLYDTGARGGNQCKIDDILTFLPEEISGDPKLVQLACNQWRAITGGRTHE